MKHNLRLYNQTLVGLLITLLTFGLMGCGPAQKNSVLTDGLIYCSEGSPTSFNPQLITSGTTIDATSRQLYNRLIAVDNGAKGKDFKKIPALAKSWHVNDDGTLITFYLREDVQFHHTPYFTPSRNMNADDVIFSFDRVINPENPFYQSAKGKFPFFQSVSFKELVSGIEKINDYTIRFKLNHPDSTFLVNIAAPFSVVLSKEYADLLLKNRPNKLALLDSKPIGTGPFRFQEYRNHSIIRFERHPEYWRRAVEIEKLIYDITPSNTGRLTKLLTHECDVISYPIAQAEIRSRSDLILEEVTSFNVAFLAFNTQKPPFDNPLVRKAISHAINREAIISAVYFDQAELADSLLPRASWAFPEDTSRFPYSRSMAKALLNDAGLGDGFSFDIWAMPVQRAYNPNALKMAKLIKSDLAQIGVNVNIITYEWSAFLRKLAKSEHQSVLIGWSADHPDPDNFFSPLLSCSATETGRNRAMWCHPEFDSLLTAALFTNNLEQRKALYRKAQDIITNEVPLFPIAHSKRAQAKVANIKGNILSPFGGISFEDAGKIEGGN